jgi:hypothetical protein
VIRGVKSEAPKPLANNGNAYDSHHLTDHTRIEQVDDGLDIPDWLRREPKVVRAPAFGPVADRLDDLK